MAKSLREVQCAFFYSVQRAASTWITSVSRSCSLYSQQQVWSERFNTSRHKSVQTFANKLPLVKVNTSHLHRTSFESVCVGVCLWRCGSEMLDPTMVRGQGGQEGLRKALYQRYQHLLCERLTSWTEELATVSPSGRLMSYTNTPAGTDWCQIWPSSSSCLNWDTVNWIQLMYKLPFLPLKKNTYIESFYLWKN